MNKLKKHIKYLKSKINDKKRPILISMGCSIILLLICYFVNNLPYQFLEEATIGQKWEQLKLYLHPTEEEVPDSIIFINVAYDRQLVDVDDDFGLPKGNIDITDRTKLYDFLISIYECNYRYMLLDVNFQKGLATEVDSVLFDLIYKMPNLVIAKSHSTEIEDERLKSKAFYSDYSTHISETNFVKYDFYQDGEWALPVKAYNDLYGDPIHKFGPFYTFKNHLAQKCVILKFPVKLWSEGVIDENSGFVKPQWYNLGADILDSGIDACALVRNKIVVIGDVSENDMHDTYLGKIAGPVINLNAIYALINGNPCISYWEIIILFLIYTLISYIILTKHSVKTWINKIIKSDLLKFLLSFATLTILLGIMGLIAYVTYGIELNVFIPALFFSIMQFTVNFKNQYHKQ